jgi:hypothetical protein
MNALNQPTLQFRRANMTFKKGDKVRTDDGQAGEILFIDRGGLEAQVALARTSVKLRTDTLELFETEPVSRSTGKSNARSDSSPGKKRGSSKPRQ